MQLTKKAQQVAPDKRAAPAGDLTQKIRRCAEQIRMVDAECKAIIEAYVDQQKASLAGKDLPRGVLERQLINRFHQPWFAVLGLEEEHERNLRT